MGAEQLNDLLAFWNDFKLTCEILCRREKWTACWCMFTERDYERHCERVHPLWWRETSKCIIPA